MEHHTSMLPLSNSAGRETSLAVLSFPAASASEKSAIQEESTGISP
jgi:hypothetical protein